MTDKELLHAMGGIDPRLIAEAAPDVPQKRAGGPFIKWAALAACFVFIVGALIAVPLFRNHQGIVPPDDTVMKSDPPPPGTTDQKDPPPTDTTDPKDPPKSIGVRSLEQLDEMRMMLQRSDEELAAYLLSVEGGGIESREDIENFLDLIDSLPILEMIHGDIIWIAHHYNQNSLTGEQQDGVVYISTMSSTGDWTRIEYLLAVKDVSGELEKLKADGQFDKSTISDVVQSENGRIKVFSEVKEAHPSGVGDTVEWMLTVDNIFARVVYYTANANDVQASSFFKNVNVTHISTNEASKNKK